MPKILVVDDEQSMRSMLRIMLKKEGYQATCAASGEEAIELCEKQNYDLVLTDIKMGGMNGLQVLQKVKELNPDTAVIMITAFASMETAVDAMKEGAYDYISKPFDISQVKQVVNNSLKRRKSIKEDTSPKKRIEDKDPTGTMVGRSPEMRKIFDLIPRISSTTTSVLITGESGTGKELVARAIHNQSAQKDKPFIAINCAGIPETLLESELFGHKKGSFTGAIADRIGFFEAAKGGTIFLDEIGDLSLALQAKLLRVVQEKIFTPVGDTKEIHLEVRIISATNKDLEKAVIANEFREDLYYRLNVIQVRVPTLRERREDIPLLAQYFLEKYSRKTEKDIEQISSYAMNALFDYNFPGNVRELENIIERSVSLESSNIILPESLTLSLFKKKIKQESRLEIEIPPEGIDLEKIMVELEKKLLLKALDRCRGVKKKAAKLLNISFRSLRYRLEKAGIEDIDKSGNEEGQS